MTSVNPYTLNGQVGHSSHMVVVTGYDRDYFYINDPGKPALKRMIGVHLFSKAVYSATFILTSEDV